MLYSISINVDDSGKWIYDLNSIPEIKFYSIGIDSSSYPYHFYPYHFQPRFHTDVNDIFIKDFKGISMGCITDGKQDKWDDHVKRMKDV